MIPLTTYEELRASCDADVQVTYSDSKWKMLFFLGTPVLHPQHSICQPWCYFTIQHWDRSSVPSVLDQLLLARASLRVVANADVTGINIILEGRTAQVALMSILR